MPEDYPILPTLTEAECYAIFGQPWETLAQQAAHHTLSVQQWLPSQAPQVARFDGIGTIAVSNGMDVRLFNQTLGANYPNNDEIDGEISAVKSFFTRASAPWMWWIDPFAQPSDMLTRLAAHGIHQYWALPTMMAPLPLQSGPPLNPEISVWQAQNYDDLAAASLIRREAFQFRGDAGQNYFQDMASAWLDNPVARIYLARLNEEAPAAIGAMIIKDGLPGVYVMATRPEWGRRGLGKAILSRIMQEAADLGFERIVLTASEKGRQLYTQYGFRNLFNFALCRERR